MKVIGYVRVSTDRQADKGSSLATQEKSIRAWAKTNGHRLLSVERDEGVSGANGLASRAGLPIALAALEDGKADALVVYRLDRLARDLLVQETVIGRLGRKGRPVISVTEPEAESDDATRVLVRQVLGAIAEYERKVIAARTQAGKAAKRARGGYAGDGSPAFGQRADGGRLVDHDEEQATLERIRELHDAGDSLRAIATTLEAEGHRPKRGARWHPESLRRIVARLDG